MQLSYGSLAFENNGVVIATSVQTTLSDSGSPVTQVHAWNVSGQWTGTQSEVLAKCAIMERTLAIPGLDLVFRRDGGTVARALLSRGSLSGVRITAGPSYPEARGGELSTFASFSFTAEAEYPAVPGAILYRSQRESIVISGGLPLSVWKPALKGPAQKQVTTGPMPWSVTQAGSAAAAGTSPPRPGYILPASDLVAQQFSVSSDGRWYTAEWSYQFQTFAAVNLLRLR